MENVIVVDDFIDKGSQEMTEDSIFSEYFPFYRMPQTVNVGEKSTTHEIEMSRDKNSKDSFFYGHSFLINGNVLSDKFHIVTPFFFKIQEYFNKRCNFERARLNITFPDFKLKEDIYYPPHIDFSSSGGWVGIYYVNDSDGDTLLFNLNKEVSHRISSKKGRMMFCRNDIFHAGSAPRANNLRCVLNFNFVPNLCVDN
jgi:hypothetical protein